MYIIVITFLDITRNTREITLSLSNHALLLFEQADNLRRIPKSTVYSTINLSIDQRNLVNTLTTIRCRHWYVMGTCVAMINTTTSGSRWQMLSGLWYASTVTLAGSLRTVHNKQRAKCASEA